ncbi:MAG TPA: energy transducer TonB [Brevundimonas sp.]|jgi:protein TonB
MGPWDPAPPEVEAPAPEPRRRGSRIGVWLVVIAALIAFAAFVLANFRFTLGEVSYSDEAVDVEIIEPLPRPAPEPRPSAPPAPPPDPEPAVGPNGEVLRHPVWLRQPAPDFPTMAMRRGVEEGAVVLRCETFATGEFGACEALSETPGGAGFADAALASMRQARVKPYSIDGFETDSEIQFTVRFRMAP